MAEVRTVTTLIAKRDEIERSIANYDSRSEQARADLSDVNAVNSIFEAAGDRDTTTAYTDIHPLLRRGELTAICTAALAEHGPMNARALLTHILAAKGLDGGIACLEKSVAGRLIHALRMQHECWKIAIAGKERGAIVWRVVASHQT